MSETVQCPACGKIIAVKGIPKHTNGCALWETVIGVPPSQFNFEKHFKRGLYAETAVEGETFVVCLLCTDHRAKRLADHLKLVHGLSLSEYVQQFSKALTSAEGPKKQRSATTLEKYGVSNVAQADEVRVLLRENNRSQDPEVVAKREATNKERYGHVNPFGGETVKHQIRETMVERYGAHSPQLVPEIFARTQQTIRDQHDGKHFFETEEFHKQFVETSQKHFGTDHPMQSKEGKAIWETCNMEKLGVRSALLLPEVQKRAYETNLSNHGGKHSQQCPEVLEKARVTWMEKYGTDNPSKVESIKEKIKEVWMGKYGVPFPPQSLWTNQKQSFPNGLERKVIAMAPLCLVYAGDGSYWVHAPGENKTRNPDFVVLTADQLKSYQNGEKLNNLRTDQACEIFGDYWHGPSKTGVDRETHMSDVFSYYEKAGISCLIIWESEVNKHPKRVAERLLAFLGA